MNNNTLGLVERVKEAYRKTGFTPAQGVFFDRRTSPIRSFTASVRKESANDRKDRRSSSG